MIKSPSTFKPLAIVTGASSGIGFELAKIFSQEGYDLIIAAEDVGIFGAAEAINQNERDHWIKPLQLDLSSPEAVDTLYQAIQSTGRPVDAIALNAGVGVSGPFIETDLEAEYNLIRLNIVSVVHLAKCVLRDMVRRGTGRMLFTSSIAGEMPGPFYAVYAASKAFIQSFSEALRTEVKDTGVTITALQPGATDTNFFARAGMLDTKAGQSKKDNAADVARDGYEALMAGKDHVVAGSFKNKIQVGVGKLVSEAQGATLQAPQTRPLRKGA